MVDYSSRVIPEVKISIDTTYYKGEVLALCVEKPLVEFYGDLVYKFKKIRGNTDFSGKFRKIIMRNKRIGYNLIVMRQSACLVINPITVDGYATLLNCTPVDRRQTP